MRRLPIIAAGVATVAAGRHRIAVNCRSPQPEGVFDGPEHCYQQVAACSAIMWRRIVQPLRSTVPTSHGWQGAGNAALLGTGKYPAR